MWRLPLTARLRDQLKSQVADMRNRGPRRVIEVNGNQGCRSTATPSQDHRLDRVDLEPERRPSGR
jgi:hypothetical protein